ncbi:enoyl-CoA hydratase-related protein [Marinibactrum halimedae]|nr:enoyl-CoA hydratase-related protein [Marinibactrum halimedae]MCD9458508.1 enoyl-CoA hydratase-related protein [Marinibactrum halimedae]
MSILIEKNHRVVTIRLNRPKARNALNTQLLSELVSVLQELDQSPEVGCFIITGSDTVFSAGADIKEMRSKSYHQMVQEDYFSKWEQFTTLRTPKIAAICGPALGGGCELALMCDIIFAAENALMGLPEITLGVIPGIGGTQRLTKAVGKAKAMDMILTGKHLSAFEAEKAGLVSRVCPTEQLLDEAITAASVIAGYGKFATTSAKEAVDQAQEMSLKDGILFERRIFHALFATEDQKEGMSAFIEKRSPQFRGY